MRLSFKFGITNYTHIHICLGHISNKQRKKKSPQKYHRNRHISRNYVVNIKSSCHQGTNFTSVISKMFSFLKLANGF